MTTSAILPTTARSDPPGIELWTNPDDIVLSPFAGIGSEGVVATELGRKYIGIELKESYYRQAVLNLQNADNQMDLLA